MKDLSREIEYLKSITDSTPHNTGVMFSRHLEDVARYLEKWDLPRHIVVAGLFHSIYGSEGFQGFCLPCDRRDEVQNVIGHEAERLAYCYSALTLSSFDASVRDDDPQLWDRFTDEALIITDEEFVALKWMYLANTREIEERLPDEKKVADIAFWRMIARCLGARAHESWCHIYGRLICDGDLARV